MKSQHICGINKFEERDIDLLLAEELRVNPEFCSWIMGHFGATDHFIFPATNTNISVVEDGSEADVVATFQKKNGHLHRLFVENKINAPLMPQQLERYVRRATGELDRGLIASHSILFFTPSGYNCSLPAGVIRMSFEAAAEALRSRPENLRSEYRASLLEKALPLRSPSARDAHVIATDPYIRNWWDAVYEMTERVFPVFFHHKTRYPRSVYFAPETSGQAGYLRVDFKGHLGEVDLAFKNISAMDIQRVLSMTGPCPGDVIINGKSTAIRISRLEKFVISDGFGIIETKVRAAYQAAYDLLVFWKENQAAFDACAKHADPGP